MKKQRDGLAFKVVKKIGSCLRKRVRETTGGGLVDWSTHLQLKEGRGRAVTDRWSMPRQIDALARGDGTNYIRLQGRPREVYVRWEGRLTGGMAMRVRLPQGVAFT